MEPEDVVVQLNFGIAGAHAGLFVAEAEGFYQEEGLNVTLVPGEGSGLALQTLSAGQADFAISGMSNVILARTEGSEAKSVMLIYDLSPIAIASDASLLELQSPDDLSGASVAAADGTVIAAMMPVLLDVNGVDESTVEIVNVSPSLYTQALLQGEVDATSAFTNESGVVLQTSAAEENVDLSFLLFREWGVDTYNNALVTTDSLISENPQLVERMVRAVAKGYAFAMENPEAARDIMLDAASQLPAEVTLTQIQETAALADTEAFAENGYGWADPAKMEFTLETLLVSYDREADFGIDDIHTNEFVGPFE